jgi:hypothetical protein
MSTTDRANPFADVGDLPAFAPKTKAPKPVSQEQIEQIAEANNFPSRQAQPTRAPVSAPLKQRRYKTGRNQQINVKATSQVIERFYKLADARAVPLGELLRQALDALEKGGAAEGPVQ